MSIKIVKADEFCDACDCYDRGHSVLKLGFAVFCQHCVRQLLKFLEEEPDALEKLKV